MGSRGERGDKGSEGDAGENGRHVREHSYILIISLEPQILGALNI